MAILILLPAATRTGIIAANLCTDADWLRLAGLCFCGGGARCHWFSIRLESHANSFPMGEREFMRARDAGGTACRDVLWSGGK